MPPLPVSYHPPEFVDPEILFIDDHLLVVNKPAGLLSVPGRGEDKKDCLVARVQLNYPDALIVHRLDMPTSGVMIMAQNKSIHAELSKYFAQRKVHKEYIAVVNGILKEPAGIINLPLITDWPNRPRQKVDFETGKPSITNYEVLSTDTIKKTTRLKLKPLTGRSHQLRVHLFSIGHIILGDSLYADGHVDSKSDRLLLHASRIKFTHPITGSVIDIESEVPF